MQFANGPISRTALAAVIARACVKEPGLAPKRLMSLLPTLRLRPSQREKKLSLIELDELLS